MDNVFIEDCMKNVNFTNYEFRNLRKRNDIYVDKTRYIYSLLSCGDSILVNTAPRRFGKSLTISTFESLFSGQRELFRGLYIDYTNYDFSFHPVIKIDFAGLGTYTAADTELYIKDALTLCAKNNVVDLVDSSPDRMLRMLCFSLNEKYSAAPVILIDEYDRPINSCYDKNERVLIQRCLCGFFSSFKALVPFLRFVYITGVLHFTGLGVFSGLNNILDISMDRPYSGLLGYTEDEIITYFAEGIQEYAEKEGLTCSEVIDELRSWYDGYLLAPGGARVYNPVSIGAFMYYLEFRNFWVKTGSSELEVQYARKYHIALVDLGDMILDSDSLDAFNILDFLNGERMSDDKLLKLLFMSGYLTIDYEKDGLLYLRFPNREVRRSLFLDWGLAYSPDDMDIELYTPSRRIRNALSAADIDQAIRVVNEVLSILCYDHYKGDELTYCGFLMSIFGASLEDVPRGEEHTARGRMDIFLSAGNHIYIAEVKLDGKASSALEQIEARGYADKYRSTGKNVHLLGLNIDSTAHRISDYSIEDIN